MGKYISLLIICCIATKAFYAQNDTIWAYPEDTKSPQAIVKALYTIISGPAGEQRNWQRFRKLFTTEAKLIPISTRPGGESVKRPLSIEEYITTAGPYLEKEGFFEREIGSKVELFGYMAHVFSTYESRRKASDEKPFMRGINSIQLWNDGVRWWIVNIIFQNESKDYPIPGGYIGR
ncbi:MAG TPA: hypothetical protein VFZ42_10990 [Chitinophagaceae bacterium]